MRIEGGVERSELRVKTESLQDAQRGRGKRCDCARFESNRIREKAVASDS
jgi:hypothetical protein